jgi:hypothetical protein
MARKKKEDVAAVPVRGAEETLDAGASSEALPAAATPEPEPVKVEVKEGPYDANAALYKDRSGASTKDVQSEGAANFAFHTAQARSESQ